MVHIVGEKGHQDCETIYQTDHIVVQYHTTLESESGPELGNHVLTAALSLRAIDDFQIFKWVLVDFEDEKKVKNDQDSL